LAYDTAKIGDVSAASMGFGEIVSAQGMNNSPMSGIIGLAYESISTDNLKTWMDVNSL